MKLFTGWVLATGLVFVTAGAQAQTSAPSEIGRSPATTVSDIGGPYAAVPDVARPGPRLLPPMEVYTVLRESGFSPLGIPQRRGFVYTIAVVDRGGEDGRLVIDARNGRVLRFVRGYGIGGIFNDDPAVGYGAQGTSGPTGIHGPQGALPPPTNVRGTPRPPRSVPHVASRTVPVPKANPLAATPAAEPAPQSAATQPAPAAPQPAQQAASAQPKPADAPPAQQAAAPTVGQTKPSALPPQPTQEMPKVQGLE